MALPLLVLAGSATAQFNIVSPSVFANIAAPSANTHPLGTATTTSPTMRYMSIHDDLAGRLALVRGLALRQNESAPTTAVTLQLEVRISTAATLASTASTTFDTNHGVNKVTVVAPNTPLSIPVLPAIAPVPPFALAVPFSTIFIHTGTGTGTGIAWEMLITARTAPVAFSHDATSGNAAFAFRSAPFGSGCTATGRALAATSGSTYVGTTVTLTSADLTGSAPGVLVLGASMASWGAVPLPFDLPGTTGYPSGTCRVHCDWVLDVPQATTALGALSQSFPLALGPATLGAVIYHYGATLDAAANGLQLVTSGACASGFGGGVPIRGGCRIYAYNSVSAATGTKDTVLLVTLFQ